MALLPILTAPDPRLKKKSKPVDAVDAEIGRLMDDMLETMYAAPGIGLAAPQVGVLKRVIVLALCLIGLIAVAVAAIPSPRPMKPRRSLVPESILKTDTRRPAWTPSRWKRGMIRSSAKRNVNQGSW